MKRSYTIKTFLSATVLMACGLTYSWAALPMVEDREWVGNYMVNSNNNYSFVISTDGQCRLFVTGKDDKPMINDGMIVDFLIEELEPDGKILKKAFFPEFLESDQPPGMKIKDVTVKGKAQDDVLFELFLTEERGGMLLGGRIIEPGKAKNPARVAIEVRIPNVAPQIPADKDVDERKAKRELERLMKSERLSLKWIDGKSVKPDILEPIDASSPEVSGPGIATLSAEFGKLGGAKLEFAAAPNSALKLSNDPTKSLSQGFIVRWAADPAKDPQSKARLSLQVK